MSLLPDKHTPRGQAARALAVNAATKPVNVAVPAAMAVTAIVLGQWWLIAMAAVVYAALAAITLFDAGEADQVNRRRGRARRQALSSEQAKELEVLAPEIRRRLDDAIREEDALRAAVADSDLSFDDVLAEVDTLMQSLRTIARRAQKLHAYLQTTDPVALRRRIGDLEVAGKDGELLAALREQQDTMGKAQAQQQRLDEQMEHAAAVLGVMCGQVVQMSVQADSLAERKVTEQAAELRAQIAAAAQSMDELASEEL